MIIANKCADILRKVALKCNWGYNLKFDKLNEALKDKVKIKYSIQSAVNIP